MSELLPLVEERFSRYFGSAPDHVVKAPGRVNLIGEHTDYNDGFVFPCAVDYHLLIAVSAREDECIEALAIDWEGQSDCFSLLEDISFHPSQMWSNYIRGVASEMQARGYILAGCNLAVTGNVPQGAGMSSSAALEVGVIRAIAQVSGLELARVEIAEIGQAAENVFVGCACGIMDQLISVAGEEGHAVAIDCSSLELSPMRIPETLSLLVFNSNVQRGLVDSEYNLRREQCEAAARFFGKTSLREVSLEEFHLRRSELEPVVAKRAQHVLEENQRVLDCMLAFEQNDIPRISGLMAESHRSMKDLFEITTPEIDFLVECIARVIGERGGVRMTGGGFGGCVVVLLPDSLVDEVIAAVACEYQAQTGLQETVFRTRPAAGLALLR